MFNLLTDVIDNGLGVLGALVDGEIPTQRQVAQLISDGVSIVAIAEATGLTVGAIEKILDD